MANIIRARSWGQVTPPLGVKFDAGHPLAQNLAGAWIGQPGSPAQIDDLLGLHTVRIADTTSVGRPLGPYTPTGGRGYEIQSVGSSLRPVSSVSLMWRGVMVGTSDATTEMFGIGYNSTTTSPFASYELARNGTDLQWYMSAGGGFTNLTLDAAPPVGIPVTYVVTWPFGSNVVCYRNGVQIYKSPSTYAAPIYSTTSTMHINGGGSATARSANCITQAGYIWKERVLSPQDAIALATEPYAMFAAPGPKILYIDLGSPGIIAKTGSVLCSLTSLGEFTGAKGAAGTIRGIAAFTGRETGAKGGLGSVDAPMTATGRESGAKGATGAVVGSLTSTARAGGLKGIIGAIRGTIASWFSITPPTPPQQIGGSSVSTRRDNVNTRTRR